MLRGIPPPTPNESEENRVRPAAPRRLARATLALAALALAAAPAGAQVVASRNLELKSQWNEWPVSPTNPYSACWSYIHHDGREYAILGVATGTAIYNVTDPVNSYRVGFIPGPGPCTWREMKSYRNWIYLVSECRGANEGLQIIRMTNPESPVLAGTYAGQFVTSHTVAVDTSRALLVCNGTRRQISGGTPNQLESSGMFVLSLADPEAPAVVSRWPSTPIPIPASMYVHDSVPIGDRLYASSIYTGVQRILDLADPAAPSQIHEWTYPGAFCHNAWPNATGDVLYVTDEVNGEPLKVFDISTPTAPVMSGTWTSNESAIVHNVHVLGDELYLSNYTEGVRILDISDPLHPAEFAFADSWGGPSGGFFSVWEVCPFFPSGTVVASDMQSGLYVYRPVRNYGLVHVQVSTGGDASGVRVRLLEPGDSLLTGADGAVRFAPDPGTYTVEASRFGYEPAQAVVSVSLGATEIVNLTLEAKPLTDFSGVVRESGSEAPLEDASVNLRYTPVHGHTNAAGDFLLSGVPVDEYPIQVGRPGSIPVQIDGVIGPGPTVQDFWLVPTATWDALETASAWTVGSGTDNATTGLWTRVEPLGTSSAPAAPLGPLGDAFGRGRLRSQHEGHESDGVLGEVQPETDRTPPPGQLCFITGQGTDPNNIGESDVDNGRTTLTSPRLDLTGMSEPTIGFWRWFYGSQPTSDFLAILLSNDDGASWTPVDSIYGQQPHWVEEIVRVTDYLPATGTMRIRFEAADFGTGSIVEAAIDDLVTYEAATPVVGTPFSPSRLLSWRAPSPNPSRASVALELQVPVASAVHAAIVDARGARVRTLHAGEVPAGRLALSWDGRDDAGRTAAAGLYFAIARRGDETAVRRLVRLP
jgi:choice-of-anchor B domain-containing protein